MNGREVGMSGFRNLNFENHIFLRSIQIAFDWILLGYKSEYADILDTKQWTSQWVRGQLNIERGESVKWTSNQRLCQYS